MNQPKTIFLLTTYRVDDDGDEIPFSCAFSDKEEALKVMREVQKRNPKLLTDYIAIDLDEPNMAAYIVTQLTPIEEI